MERHRRLGIEVVKWLEDPIMCHGRALIVIVPFSTYMSYANERVGPYCFARCSVVGAIAEPLPSMSISSAML